MTKMLVIDCQILQTPAFDRGMGKYTLSLLKTFVGMYADSFAIRLLFNDNLDKVNIQKVLNVLRGGTSYETLDIPTDIGVDRDIKQARTEELLTAYIAENYVETDDITFLETAPFFVGFPSAFPQQEWVKKTSIVYDFIPLKIWNNIQIFPEDIYLKHTLVLLKADSLFTISNAVRDDLIRMFGVDPQRVLSIDGAAFDRESEVDGTAKSNAPYILMPSGPIVHKNNKRAINGFVEFNRKHENVYTLLISSTFDENTESELQQLSDNVVFIGNVTDKEFAGVYAGATALLFPSLTEGLGLPILEAVNAGLPVACSNIPVFSEISNDAFYFFNPVEEQNIASQIEAAVNREGWAARDAAYAAIKNRYTWSKTAQKLAKGLSAVTLTKKKSVKVKLRAMAPEYSSPAGVLMERLAGHLAGDGYEVIVSPTRSGGRRYTSFTKYMSNKGEADTILSLVDKKSGLLGLLGKPEVVVKLSRSELEKEMTLEAVSDLVDEDLGIHSWNFTIVGQQPEAVGMASVRRWIEENER